jgi:hypothetical protein
MDMNITASDIAARDKLYMLADILDVNFIAASCSDDLRRIEYILWDIVYKDLEAETCLPP